MQDTSFAHQLELAKIHLTKKTGYDWKIVNEGEQPPFLRLTIDLDESDPDINFDYLYLYIKGKIGEFEVFATMAKTIDKSVTKQFTGVFCISNRFMIKALSQGKFNYPLLSEGNFSNAVIHLKEITNTRWIVTKENDKKILVSFVEIPADTILAAKIKFEKKMPAETRGLFIYALERRKTENICSLQVRIEDPFTIRFFSISEIEYAATLIEQALRENQNTLFQILPEDVLQHLGPHLEPCIDPARAREKMKNSLASANTFFAFLRSNTSSVQKPLEKNDTDKNAYQVKCSIL